MCPWQGDAHLVALANADLGEKSRPGSCCNGPALAVKPGGEASANVSQGPSWSAELGAEKQQQGPGPSPSPAQARREPTGKPSTLSCGWEDDGEKSSVNEHQWYPGQGWNTSSETSRRPASLCAHIHTPGAASCVGPGKSNLPFELRRKAGDCSRVTAGPIDLI